MSSHVAHPDSEVVLQDGCPRCIEHTQQPWFTLDAENRDELLQRALGWEGRGQHRGPQGELEREACQKILDLLNAVRALVDYPSSEAVLERLVNP